MKNERMCIACRQMKDKRELLRIVKNADGIKIDPTLKAAGRGAYVCLDSNCINKLVKCKLLNKAFKCEVDAQTYSLIKEAAIER